jgi:cyclase
LERDEVRLRTRRQVMRAAAGSLAGLLVGSVAPRFRAANAQSAGLAVGALRLGDGLDVLSVGGTNVVARRDRDGIALVDGGASATADALLAALGTDASGSGIHTLFNTHWHPEQTGLNVRLGLARATIIAQENTRLWLTADITYPWDGQHFDPMPEAGRPNTTFYDDGELESGIVYGYLRHAAHTDGDLYVRFPDANVLAVGGVVSGAAWPFIDWWTHGPVLRRADLERQYDMYNTVYERLSRLLNTGRGPDEAVAARPTAEFDAEMGPSDAFVRQAFKSLWAYLSPDA